MLSTTVYVACPNGWTKLATLYGSTVRNQTGWLISCRSNTVQYAIADTTPTATYGHPITANGSVTINVGDASNVWFQNEVSATVGYLVITPIVAF